MPERMRRTATLLAATLLAGAVAGLPAPALAHPHVWVTTRAEIVYDIGGRVTGVRHAWTFDEAYSAYVTQGLDANGDGKLTPDELQDLARENTAGLAEFDYFTSLKVGGRKQAFGEPREPRMVFEDKRTTLGFFLPLRAPLAPGRAAVALEVYDPTYFIAFSLADGDDVARLAGAPKGCVANVMRPKPAPGSGGGAGAVASSGPAMSEAFFEALTAASDFGAQFANRIIVACP